MGLTLPIHLTPKAHTLIPKIRTSSCTQHTCRGGKLVGELITSPTDLVQLHPFLFSVMPTCSHELCQELARTDANAAQVVSSLSHI